MEKKNIKKENEKVANWKFGKVGNLGKVISEFSNLKISKKSFWDFQDFRSSRVLTWPVWVPTETLLVYRLIGYAILIGYLINSSFLCVITGNITILRYSGAALRPRTPSFFSWQTRKLFATNRQWNFWVYAKYLVNMFPCF